MRKALVAATAACAAAAGLAAADFDVRDFGAKGDGAADDLASVKAAVEKLSEAKGGTLLFPKGEYRIGSKAYGAIHLKGVSNVRVKFEPGAVLLMDNLQADGLGGGHGVVVAGPAKGIELYGVHVKWKAKASKRSMGDAFRFEGYPSDKETVSDVLMKDCVGEGSAQTGAVFMGCSDVKVVNFQPIDTHADGLHFNACRRVAVEGERGTNNGDDTLAFVTYYSPEPKGKRGGVFSFPELNEWCNSGSRATDISSEGGGADGMRISGGFDIEVSKLSVKRKWGGVQLDAAIESAPGEKRVVGWSYLASRKIKLRDFKFESCVRAFIVRSLNVKPDAPEKLYAFDVELDGVSASGCKDYALDVQSVGGVRVRNLETDSKVRFVNLQGPCSLEKARIKGAELLLLGIQGSKFGGFNPGNMERVPSRIKSLDELDVQGEISVADVALEGGAFNVQGISGLKAKGLKLDGDFSVKLSKDCLFKGVELGKGQLGGAALSVSDCAGLDFEELRFK